MAIPLTKLKGMTDKLRAQFESKGIHNSDQLLEACASAKQRRALASEFENAEKALLELSNRADLSRIKGVAGVYSDLLEQAGVDTVKELATRKPENLHTKIVEVNTARKLTAKLPTVDDVSQWVAQAKELPKSLMY